MNDETRDYTPIPCDLYSEYEVTILHATPLLLRWHDDSGAMQHGRVIPRDLRTEQAVEYLIAEGEGGEQLKIRLDSIVEREAAQ